MIIKTTLFEFKSHLKEIKKKPTWKQYALPKTEKQKDSVAMVIMFVHCSTNMSTWCLCSSSMSVYGEF